MCVCACAYFRPVSSLVNSFQGHVDNSNSACDLRAAGLTHTDSLVTELYLHTRTHATLHVNARSTATHHTPAQTFTCTPTPTHRSVNSPVRPPITRFVLRPLLCLGDWRCCWRPTRRWRYGWAHGRRHRVARRARRVAQQRRAHCGATAIQRLLHWRSTLHRWSAVHGWSTVGWRARRPSHAPTSHGGRAAAVRWAGQRTRGGYGTTALSGRRTHEASQLQPGAGLSSQALCGHA